MNNDKVVEDFNKWLDSSDKKAFEADDYNIFEKMSLREVRQWLTPNSENYLRSYNDTDEVPEDTWYYIGYDDGEVLRLEPGDALNGVKRSGIIFAIQDNASTTMIYAKRGSNDVSIYNNSSYKDGNDIWYYDIKNESNYKFSDVDEHKRRHGKG